MVFRKATRLRPLALGLAARLLLAPISTSPARTYHSKPRSYLGPALSFFCAPGAICFTAWRISSTPSPSKIIRVSYTYATPNRTNHFIITYLPPTPFYSTSSPAARPFSVAEPVSASVFEGPRLQSDFRGISTARRPRHHYTSCQSRCVINPPKPPPKPPKDKLYRVRGISTARGLGVNTPPATSVRHQSLQTANR